MHLAAFCPRCAGVLVESVPPLEARPRKVCSRCGFVVYVNPKIAAGTLPIRDGKLALIRRGIEPSKGAWTWPCGYVEIDETVEEGARRETLEESGLAVTVGALLGAYSYPVRAGEAFGPSTGLLVMAWATDEVAGDLAPGDDADDAGWFALDAIPWDDLAFDSSRRALRDFLARRG